MNIIPGFYKGISEFEMQDELEIILRGLKFYEGESWCKKRINHFVLREHRIPEIGRISDFIIYVTDRKIINIECKLTNYGEVFEQAKDHLLWADYSYVSLPSDSYIPNYMMHKFIKYGIGYIMYHTDINRFYEVINSSHNKAKNKELREKVLISIKRKVGELRARESQQAKIDL